MLSFNESGQDFLKDSEPWDWQHDTPEWRNYGLKSLELGALVPMSQLNTWGGIKNPVPKLTENVGIVAIQVLSGEKQSNTTLH